MSYEDHGSEEASVVRTGVNARVVPALAAALAGGAPWDRVAGDVWPQEAVVRTRARQLPYVTWTDADEARLRARLGAAIVDLRAVFFQFCVEGLVFEHDGVVTLTLQPGDTVEGATS
jgi:hypothetical protein